jgi:hypothetical protein
MAIDSKYGKITVEKEPDTPFGDDEPLFLLRGNDLLAKDVLLEYLNLAEAECSDEFIDKVNEVIATFREYRETHEDDIKLPD